MVATWRAIMTVGQQTWQPGQIVNINLPDRGVKGEYLVQRVTITPATPELWTYRIEYGGRLLGIADVLKALVSAQQKKKLGPSQAIHKMVYGQEVVGVKDELVTTPRALPFICGDADAICGLVVVSNG